MKTNIKRPLFVVLFLLCGAFASSTMSDVKPATPSPIAQNAAALDRCFFICWPSFRSCMDACGDDQDCQTQCMEENNQCLDTCEGY